MKDLKYFHLDESEFTDAEYKGKTVTLNKPFRTPDESKKFAVYAKNKRGDVVKVRFGDPDMEIKRDDAEARKAYRARHKCETQTDKSSPAYWSCRMWSEKPVSDMLDGCFKDAVFWDGETKTVFSARDGVQEYYGHEFGHPDKNRQFKILRKPEELAALVRLLEDLPVTNEHVDMTMDIPKDKLLGRIKDTEVIEDLQPGADATMALQNVVDLNDEGQRVKGLGKKYFSLAYNAELRPYAGDEADLEQYNFVPHHLALVDNPRGGENLTFKDGTMAIFKDANGDFTLSAVTQMAEELPGLLQDMPVGDLKKVKALFDKIKGEVDAELTEEDPGMTAEDENPEGGNDAEKKEGEEMKDMKPEAKPEGEEKKDEKPFTDSAEFADAVTKEASRLAAEKMAVIDKARDFLPKDYNFSDSATAKIMADAVKTEYPGESFKDSELSTAFKMMRKPERKDFSKFVDSSKHFDVAKIGKMEI